MPYILIFFIIVLLSFLELNVKRYINLYGAFFCILIFLILFAGLRDVGYDLQSYKDIFHDINTANPQDIEPGFSLFILLFKSLGSGVPVFFFFTALIAITFKGGFFIKYSPYPMLSLVIYFGFAYLIKDMGQIRHGLAMGVALIAFHFILEKKPLLFYLFALLAFSLHYSAIVLLPAYFITTRLNIKTAIITIVVLLPLVFINSKDLLFALIEHLPIETIQGKAVFYLNSEEYGQTLGFNFSIVIRITILMLMIVFRRKGKEIMPGFQTLLYLYCYGIAIYLLLNPVQEFAIRTSDYFRLLDCIILPNFILFTHNRKMQNIIWLVVCVYCYYTVYKMLALDVFQHDFIPYKFVRIENRWPLVFTLRSG